MICVISKWAQYCAIEIPDHNDGYGFVNKKVRLKWSNTLSQCFRYVYQLCKTLQ